MILVENNKNRSVAGTAFDEQRLRERVGNERNGPDDGSKRGPFKKKKKRGKETYFLPGPCVTRAHVVLCVESDGRAGRRRYFTSVGNCRPDD